MNDETTPPQEDSSPGLAPGTEFGRYRIVRLLGEGGMGAVYEAVHTDLGKRVALKTLHPEVARNPGSRLRFLQEGRSASMIRHPHVIDVTDVGVQGALPFLVMEYLDGESLASKLRREGTLSVEETVEIAAPVIAALGAAHEEKIVHRDLKPENIFLARTRDGSIVPKVIDFGISKMPDGERSHSLTSSATMLGTAYYMSPEQAHESKSVDHRADQYSLGVILYRCVTGQLPFQGGSLLALLNAVVAGVYTPPRAVRPELPEGFEVVIVQAMRREATQRYASVYELGLALLPFANDETRRQWERVFQRRGSNPVLAPTPVDTDDARGATLPVGTVPIAPALAFPVEPRPEGNASSLSPQTRPSLTPSSRGRPLIAAGVVASLLVVGGVALNGLRSSPPASVPVTASLPNALPLPVVHPTFTAHVEANPATAQIAFDDGPASPGPFHREMPRDGREHTLRIESSGFVTQTLRFRDEPPPERITLAPVVVQNTLANTVAPAIHNGVRRRFVPGNAPVARPSVSDAGTRSVSHFDRDSGIFTGRNGAAIIN